MSEHGEEEDVNVVAGPPRTTNANASSSGNRNGDENSRGNDGRGGRSVGRGGVNNRGELVEDDDDDDDEDEEVDDDDDDVDEEDDGGSRERIKEEDEDRAEARERDHSLEEHRSRGRPSRDSGGSSLSAGDKGEGGGLGSGTTNADNHSNPGGKESLPSIKATQKDRSKSVHAVLKQTKVLLLTEILHLLDLYKAHKTTSRSKNWMLLQDALERQPVGRNYKKMDRPYCFKKKVFVATQTWVDWAKARGYPDPSVLKTHSGRQKVSGTMPEFVELLYRVYNESEGGVASAAGAAEGDEDDVFVDAQDEDGADSLAGGGGGGGAGSSGNTSASGRGSGSGLVEAEEDGDDGIDSNRAGVSQTHKGLGRPPMGMRGKKRARDEAPQAGGSVPSVQSSGGPSQYPYHYYYGYPPPHYPSLPPPPHPSEFSSTVDSLFRGPGSGSGTGGMDNNSNRDGLVRSYVEGMMSYQRAAAELAFLEAQALRSRQDEEDLERLERLQARIDDGDSGRASNGAVHTSYVKARDRCLARLNREGW